MDLATWLSLVSIFLTVIGFAITAHAAFRARKAAEAAAAASSDTARKMLQVNLISELATAVQLLDELKRLQRTKAVELLPDRYSSLRSTVVGIRESSLVKSEVDLTALQDVVARLASLEKSLDLDQSNFEEPRKLARSNESISLCIDTLSALKERIRIA